MRLAVLGATSMLAADYAATCLIGGGDHDLTLFARDPARAAEALAVRGVAGRADCRPLASFADGEWDAVINFVGVGDPARAVAMGAEILSVTRDWDDRVLTYLRQRPQCRYLFLSSGAAFGSGHQAPIGVSTRATFDLNALSSSSWYGVAKFYAEAIHRATPDRSIIDIRIYNYLSEFADLSHRFLINEMIAAMRDRRTLSIDARDLQRDYLSREDFAAMVEACLNAPSGYNGAVDAYSLAPITKAEMIALFRERFGLVVETTGGGIDATGAKSAYFSINHHARTLGYRPRFDSAETLVRVAETILARQTHQQD